MTAPEQTPEEESVGIRRVREMGITVVKTVHAISVVREYPSGESPETGQENQ